MRGAHVRVRQYTKESCLSSCAPEILHRNASAAAWLAVACAPRYVLSPAKGDIMTIATILLLFTSAFLAGAVNAIAGGGTFLTFGALTLVGMPPITANATSSITQFPGYITSTFAYRDEIARSWRSAIALSVVSVIGALGGSLLLLSLDNPSFRQIVPWLLAAATIIFAAGPWLKPKASAGKPVNSKISVVAQFFTSIYGGFFGAGMGIMMLAVLGITSGGTYHHLNALKNLLSILIAAVAIVIFVSGGVVAWPQALVMIPGVALGGYAGVWMARRVSQTVMRVIVVAVGVTLTTYYFVTG